MGRWSELRAFRVCQVVCLESPVVAVVISGKVGCWSSWCGVLVGVAAFSILWVEFCMRSAIKAPLWVRTTAESER